MASVEIFGASGVPVRLAADGAVFVTGTILNMTGSYTGTLPVTGVVSVDNFPAVQEVTGTVAVETFPSGFYARQGSATKLAQVGTAVIKNAAGRVGTVSVLASGSTVGAIHDTSAGASASGSNQVAVVPAAIGIYNIDFPCAAGIVYVAGTGQTASISYE